MQSGAPPAEDGPYFLIEYGTFYSAKMKRTDLKVRNKLLCGRVLILTRSSESITAVGPKLLRLSPPTVVKHIHLHN